MPTSSKKGVKHCTVATSCKLPNHLSWQLFGKMPELQHRENQLRATSKSTRNHWLHKWRTSGTIQNATPHCFVHLKVPLWILWYYCLLCSVHKGISMWVIVFASCSTAELPAGCKGQSTHRLPASLITMCRWNTIHKLAPRCLNLLASTCTG